MQKKRLSFQNLRGAVTEKDKPDYCWLDRALDRRAARANRGTGIVVWSNLAEKKRLVSCFSRVLLRKGGGARPRGCFGGLDGKMPAKEDGKGAIKNWKSGATERPGSKASEQKDPFALSGGVAFGKIPAGRGGKKITSWEDRGKKQRRC